METPKLARLDRVELDLLCSWRTLPELDQQHIRFLVDELSKIRRSQRPGNVFLLADLKRKYTPSAPSLPVPKEVA